MTSTILELRVTPPWERDIQGVLARLTIPHAFDSKKPSICTRRYQSMDWMEHAPATEWESAKTFPVEPERARELLTKVLAVNVPLTTPSLSGIHVTAYHLKIFSVASCCEFHWYNEPPSQWRCLFEIAEGVRALADEVLGPA